LKEIATELLAVHAALLRELAGFDKRMLQLAKAEARMRLVMTAPGVGAIVGLTRVAAIDDPARFSSSKMAGPHLTDITGRISKFERRACGRAAGRWAFPE
jgi:transposase